MSKSMEWTLEPAGPGSGHRWRRRLAAGLSVASAWLGRLALHLHGSEPCSAPVSTAEPVLEFYAEAGAPEGALYVDGLRVGVLPGVSRL